MNALIYVAYATVAYIIAACICMTYEANLLSKTQASKK